MAPTSERVLSCRMKLTNGHLKRSLEVICPSSIVTKPSTTASQSGPTPEVIRSVFESFHSGLENRADMPHCSAFTASMQPGWGLGGLVVADPPLAILIPLPELVGHSSHKKDK